MKIRRRSGPFRPGPSPRGGLLRPETPAVRVGPVSRAGGTAAALAWCLAVVAATLGPIGLLAAPVVAVLGCPLLICADMLVAAVEIGPEGLRRTGLLGRSARIEWSEATRITLWRGVRGYRVAVVRGARRKAAFSTRAPGFHVAMRVLLEHARRHHISVETLPGSGTVAQWEEEFGVSRDGGAATG